MLGQFRVFVFMGSLLFLWVLCGYYKNCSYKTKLWDGYLQVMNVNAQI